MTSTRRFKPDPQKRPLISHFCAALGANIDRFTLILDFRERGRDKEEGRTGRAGRYSHTLRNPAHVYVRSDGFLCRVVHA
jgi:hypothetical protein